MEFNLHKYLVENKLTRRSMLEVDDDPDYTGDVADPEQEEVEQDVPEKEDSWYKSDDFGDSEEFEKEPTARDIKKQEPTAGKDVLSKQADLKALEDKKDALLKQFKSGQLSLDQYKKAIGNIPAQIKKLQADIKQITNVSVDDEEESY